LPFPTSKGTPVSQTNIIINNFSNFLLHLKKKELQRGFILQAGQSYLLFLRISLIVLLSLLHSFTLAAKDFIVTGKVTDASGSYVSNARISMKAGSMDYIAVTESDGTYALKISGIYSEISGLLEPGIPYPNPFTGYVHIPFIINVPGDLRFAVYSLSGQKINDTLFPATEAGSYRINWDGCTGNGAPVRQGYYIYAITFKGKTWSGRLVRSSISNSAPSGTSLEPIMMPPVPPSVSGSFHIPVTTSVTCKDYYPVRLTDIVISRDTIVDFELAKSQFLPFKTQSDRIALYTSSGYRSLNLKGINLGSSPPGYFPGEIAYAISAAQYESWISAIAAAGFNSIRIYTLHPPVFYEKLSNYNYRHPDKPLLLFQGVWLGEVEDSRDPAQYDLTLRTNSFRNDIHEVIDCIHGNRSIGFRPGRAYGDYRSDIGRWTAGYILGREISPQEVDSTNSFHPSMTTFAGSQFSITGATATESFLTRMLDATVSYEDLNYSEKHPVSISSWPTLDPLTHPTEIHTDEDKASFDIQKIAGKNFEAGLFATYHAYPYYPNFISEQPSYQSFTDAQGRNSYLGYITDLKNHYAGIPLVIGEFGVPSSWGSAHQSFSKMDHGGYSEEQQGAKNLRMMNNIFDAGCAGGFMFAWMDEWFKPTWIVGYLEAYGFNSGGNYVPTRQLWHNLLSPEQNFGLVSFSQTEILPLIPYQKNNPTGPVSKIEATNDNSMFYLNIGTSQNILPGDTIMIAFDTYSAVTGESRLPNGKPLTNRSEFLLLMIAGDDTADYYVTEAYDMKGLTPRFNLSNPLVQKFRSTNTDGAPWKVMQWINDGFELTSQDPGRLPAENTSDFTFGKRTAAAWFNNNIKIRIPWTMLYFYDPTRMKVIDGANSYDGGASYEISTSSSDGIAISVYCRGTVTSTSTRYSWDSYLVVPPTIFREKKSLQVVTSGLSALPDFAN
jgi:hypothetical protein